MEGVLVVGGHGNRCVVDGEGAGSGVMEGSGKRNDELDFGGSFEFGIADTAKGGGVVREKFGERREWLGLFS